METINHVVTALPHSLLQAAEALVGHSLAPGQQLVIHVLDGERPSRDEAAEQLQSGPLPAWCRALADLTLEEEVALDESVANRTASRRLESSTE